MKTENIFKPIDARMRTKAGRDAWEASEKSQTEQRDTAQPFIRDLLRTSRTLTDTESKLLAHAERLAEALQGWQDWSEGKRAWPKLETNEALAAWKGARK